MNDILKRLNIHEISVSFWETDHTLTHKYPICMIMKHVTSAGSSIIFSIRNDALAAMKAMCVFASLNSKGMFSYLYLFLINPYPRSWLPYPYKGPEFHNGMIIIIIIIIAGSIWVQHYWNIWVSIFSISLLTSLSF